MENANVIEGTVLPASHMNLASVLRIPAIRQVMLLVGVAAAVAAGFAIVLWSRTPEMTPLVSSADGANAAQVADALRTNGIEYKVDGGNILVPDSRLHEARMQLATQGISPDASAGLKMLEEGSSFGVSQSMESARLQHVREAELARTIAKLGFVAEASVHLGLPQQTAFIRDENAASASVFLKLLGGRTLEPAQASGIVHFVADSVPNLDAKNVTLLDQHGHLLSSGNEQDIDAQATTQFRYARKLEDEYRRRIEQLLTPLVGMGRVRAQVDADVDFTVTEEARESFEPANTVVVSEVINEENRSGDTAAAAGIPGALSNQPPEATASAADVAAASASERGETVNTSRSSSRNFEVDRTISHVRPHAGRINRLSVAVLVDDSPVEAAAEGEGAAAAITADDLARFEALVKEAVGFDEARGDSVVVVNAAFRNMGPMEEIEPPAFWEKPVLVDAMKQVLGAGLALALVFFVVRPMLRGVLASNSAAPGSDFGAAGTEVVAAGGGVQLAGAGAATAAIPPPNYDEKVAAAKNITGHDPARVAQVVKQWVSADE